MAQGSAAGLGLLDELEASGEPRDDFLLPGSRAGPLRWAGDWTAAPQARRQPLQSAGPQEGRRFFRAGYGRWRANLNLPRRANDGERGMFDRRTRPPPGGFAQRSG